MNFIASVLIAEVGEENGFYVMIYLLLNHEMKVLFLPVSDSVSYPIGVSRTASQKFLNGITNQVSYAQTIFAFEKNINDTRLLYF